MRRVARGESWGPRMMPMRCAAVRVPPRRVHVMPRVAPGSPSRSRPGPGRLLLSIGGRLHWLGADWAAPAGAVPWCGARSRSISTALAFSRGPRCAGAHCASTPSWSRPRVARTFSRSARGRRGRVHVETSPPAGRGSRTASAPPGRWTACFAWGRGPARPRPVSAAPGRAVLRRETFWREQPRWAPSLSGAFRAATPMLATSGGRTHRHRREVAGRDRPRVDGLVAPGTREPVARPLTTGGCRPTSAWSAALRRTRGWAP